MQILSQFIGVNQAVPSTPKDNNWNKTNKARSFVTAHNHASRKKSVLDKGCE